MTPTMLIEATTAYNWIRLHIIPGTNEVVLQGLSRIRLKWEVNPSRLDPNFGKEYV